MTSELKKWEIAEPGDTNLRLVTPSGHVLAKSYDYVIVGAGSGGLRGRRPPPSGHGRTRPPAQSRGPGGGPQPLEPAAVGGEPRFTIRLGLSLRAEPTRRWPLHPLGIGQGARR